jgi:hypothetical protein
MKAWLCSAAIFLLGGLCVWQHVELKRLRALREEVAEVTTQSSPRVAGDVEKLVAGLLVNETLSKLQAVPSVPKAVRVPRPRETRRRVVIPPKFDESAELNQSLPNLNFRMVRPAPAAPGSRRPEFLRYERVILEPAILPQRTGTTLPYGLYGR